MSMLSSVATVDAQGTMVSRAEIRFANRDSGGIRNLKWKSTNGGVDDGWRWWVQAHGCGVVN